MPELPKHASVSVDLPSAIVVRRHEQREIDRLHGGCLTRSMAWATSSGDWAYRTNDGVCLTSGADLNYGALTGVQDGNMAMEAHYEAIQPETTPAPPGGDPQSARRLLPFCFCRSKWTLQTCGEYPG